MLTQKYCLGSDQNPSQKWRPTRCIYYGFSSAFICCDLVNGTVTQSQRRMVKTVQNVAKINWIVANDFHLIDAVKSYL